MDTDMEIRALSWKQPYASLMLHGKVETRSWNTKYRGLVLICSSKRDYKLDEVLRISGKKQLGRILNVFELHGYEQPSGMAIAIGELVNVKEMTPWDEDDCYVDWQPNLWCHVYSNVQAIEPFPWKGSQGWRILDEETKRKIKIL